jgi:putative GTP pyrophosphokinase
MKDPRQFKQFLAHYERHVASVLTPTYEEIKRALEKWRQPGYWARFTKKSRLPDPFPVQRFHVRIKRPESVVDKILRKPDDFPAGLVKQSFHGMDDAVGARAIVYFLSMLPLVDRELRESQDFEVSKDQPPVAYLGADIMKRLGLIHITRREKDSGYASIHYTLRLKQSSVAREQRPWFELQVRTLAEDLWGEIEHVLGYKPEKRTSFAVRKQFKLISQLLCTIDDHFNFLYEELSRYQEEVTYKDTDPLNAENVAAVLSEIGVGCAQREIDGLLKLLASRSVREVGHLRSLAKPSRLEIIRNTYRSEKGRAPINFEIVANLANLSECQDDETAVDLIKTQIAYLEAWDLMRATLPRGKHSPST